MSRTTVPKTLTSLLLIALFAVPCPAEANLILNGDFAGGSGAYWVFADQSITISPGAILTSSPCCPDILFPPTFETASLAGLTFWYDPVDIDYGTITQSFATTPGGLYLVNYLFGVSAQGGIGNGVFVAAFDGKAFLPAGTSTVNPNGPGLTPLSNDYLESLATPISGSPSQGLFYGPGLFGSVFLENTPIAYSTSGAGLADVTLSPQSFLAFATGTSTTLEFAGGCPGCNWLVTNVSVTRVAEPDALSLVVGALLLLAWRTRRAIAIIV